MRLRLILFILLVPCVLYAQEIAIMTGTYAGDGNDDRWISTGVDVTLKMVIVMCGDKTNADEIVWSTASHPSGESQRLSTGDSLNTNLIQSLTADSFQVGTDSDVNDASDHFFYLAIGGSGTGWFKTDTYSGNGTNPTSFSGFGFQPGFVIICGTTSGPIAVYKLSSMGGDTSSCYGATNSRTGHFVTLDADGFTVTGGNNVNASGRTYYYFAMKDLANVCYSNHYKGDGSGPRSLTGVGFQGDYIHIREPASATATRSLAKVNETINGRTDRSTETSSAQDRIGAIDTFDADGFSIHSSLDYVNRSGSIYHYIVLNDTSITSRAGRVIVTGGNDD